ncbi:unnamed protein product [Calypogeia fissa]
MSSRGRKRGAGNGSPGIMQQQGQVRQGSSFWTCPACNTAVHTALMSFHISSCPVVAADEVNTPMNKTLAKPSLPLRQLQIDAKQGEEQGTEQSTPLGSPGFTLMRKRGVPQNVPLGEGDEEDELAMIPRKRPRPRNVSVLEDDSDEKEDVLQEEQQVKNLAPSPPLHQSMDDGSRGEKLLPCSHPETPIQEGRDRIGVDDGQMTVSPSPAEQSLKSVPQPAEVRKRLFEDWGQMLSPEPNELVVQLSQLSPHQAASAAASPSSVSPQAKRHRVTEFDEDESRMVVDFGLTDLGNAAAEETLPYLGSVHDSQQELQGEVVSLDHTDKSPHDLEKTLDTDQNLQADDIFSPETAAELQDGKRSGDGLSHREMQLENVIRELKEKCSGASLRETKLQQMLQLKNDECERLHRRGQELQSELSSVRGQLETTLQDLRHIVSKGEQTAANEVHIPDQSATQIYKEDEYTATQFLSQTSNTPASCCSSPRATRDEFAITRVSSVRSEDRMKAHNVVEIGDEEEGTQLFSDGLNPGCSPNMDEDGKNSGASTEFRRVNKTCTGPSDVNSLEPFSTIRAILGEVDKSLARRLFDEGTKTSNRNLDGEVSSPLPCSMYGAPVLAPYTPGKALLMVADEHEERDEVGGEDNSNLYTIGDQRTEGTPGGGPKTPDNFAVMLAGQEKGLIRDMLNSFPPAQGIETDPFDDHFRGTVNNTTSHVPSASKDDPIPMQEDGQTLVSHGVGENLRLDNERLNDCNTSASPQASEDGQQETLRETGPKKKRRKSALVVDSDSEEDIADQDSAHDVSDSWKGTKEGTPSGTRVDKLDTDSHPDPVMEASSKEISLYQRPPSSPQIDDLFGTEGEGNAPGISASTGRKEVDKSCSVGSPDPIIEILRTDRQLFSSPSVNIVLSSDEEEDICESSGGSGKKGKRRRLVKVQESPGGTKTLQADANSDGAKETGTQVLRRSERLRRVHESAPNQITLLSERDGKSASDEGRSEGLGTSGPSSKPHLPDDDEDEIIDIDSDSSDGRPTGAVYKRRGTTATQQNRYAGAENKFFGIKDEVGDEEGEDDIESNDSGFINDVPESDVEAGSLSAVDEISDSGEESENDDSSASKSSSEGHKKFYWKFEGDMLATLAKDKELCLRGLCAIYRRQEDDEKIFALSKYKNHRGFSKFHSAKGSLIASFLMGDTISGPVVKTVKELQDKYDEDAVTYCSDMCSHYSKQLFEIYENNEDPYFPEPYTDPIV